MAEDEGLARRAEILTSMGVSHVTAAGLLTQMPELGRLDAKAVASLAGLAPVTRQSGAWQGRSFIQGGRARARRLLYMPALAAIRSALGKSRGRSRSCASPPAPTHCSNRTALAPRTARSSRPVPQPGVATLRLCSGPSGDTLGPLRHGGSDGPAVFRRPGPGQTGRGTRTSDVSQIRSRWPARIVMVGSRFRNRSRMFVAPWASPCPAPAWKP